jgi:glyoxylase-like metal-dependent hydrolase (beta-lactamase superfamily II)
VKRSVMMAVCLGSIGMAGSASAQEPVNPNREISAIAADLFLARDGRQYTIFAVTPQGIIVGDPLFVTTAQWLKDELALRFPDRDIKYVLHTSHNFERAAGGEVFKPAEVVAHERFVEEVQRSYRSLPPAFEDLDRNKNRILERTEYANTPGEMLLATRDLDHDGNITRQELYGLIATGLVRSTYVGDRTIRLGDREVELIHPGRARGADMTVLYFPAERLLFAADFLEVHSFPAAVGPYQLREYIAALRTIESLDFTTFITGLGERGTRQDVVALRTYLEELLAAVRTGRQEGRTAGQLQASLRFDQYAGWENYGTRRSANIAEAYSLLHEVTTDVYGAPTTSFLTRGTLLNQFACRPSSSYECAAPGGAASGGIIGMLVSYRRLAVSGEVNLGTDFTGFRRFVRIQANDFEFKHRDTIASFLFRVAALQTPRATVSVGVGPSVVRSRTYSAFHTVSGLLDLEETLTETRRAFTTGIDARLRLTRTMSFFIPVRFANTPRGDALQYYGLGKMSTSVGAGMIVEVGRRVR